MTKDVLAELEKQVVHPPFGNHPEFQKKTEDTFRMVKEKFTELCPDPDNGI